MTIRKKQTTKSKEQKDKQLFSKFRRSGKTITEARAAVSAHNKIAGESDPTGRSAHAAGAKLDAGKPRVSLVLDGFPRALEEVAKVGTYGAEKYSDNGWMTVPDGISRYKDAMGRHRIAGAKGEVIDPETGLLHSAQEAWNALAKLELELRKLEDV